MVKKYENDFKVLIVELLESGRTTQELSEEYSIGATTIRRWRREYKARSGDFTKKKELKEIRLERDILKKAVSIFSKSDR